MVLINVKKNKKIKSLISVSLIDKHLFRMSEIETNSSLRTKAVINMFTPALISTFLIIGIYGFSEADKTALLVFFQLFFSTESGPLLIMIIGLIIIVSALYFLYDFLNNYLEDLAGYEFYDDIVEKLGDKAAGELTSKIYELSAERLLSENDLPENDQNDVEDYIQSYIEPATKKAVNLFYKYYIIGLGIAFILIGMFFLLSPRAIGLPIILFLLPIMIPVILNEISRKIEETRIGDVNLELFLNLYKQLNIYEERFKLLK